MEAYQSFHSRTLTPTRTNRFKRPALAAPPASLKVVAIPTINLLHTLNSTNAVWRPEPEKTMDGFFYEVALTDQLRRAVVSIPSNIAEGNGRGSNKDYAHFLSIARGSLYETMTQLRIAKDLGYLDDYSQFEDIAAEVGRMLGAMLKKYGSIHCSPSP